MPCYRPVTAFKPLSGGAITFSEKANSREIKIRCGRCIGCRIDKRDMWAVRCYAESKTHDSNSFVTLTYNEESFPQYGSLNYRDFQLFMKRARKRLGPFRFFVCGEYGEELSRPHYHALFFGLDFPDKVKCNSIHASEDVFTSAILSDLWPHGFHSIGNVTYESARYCAQYICKKHSDDTRYMRVVPETGEIVTLEKEFAQMSLKPGIGALWLERYWRDIYVAGHGGVVINGHTHKAPRYFDEKMIEASPALMEDYAFQRELLAQRFALDSTPERLATRELVAEAKVRFNNERKL